MTLLSVETPAQLKGHLSENIPGLTRETMPGKALLLCDWVSSKANYCGRELRLEWKGEFNLIPLLRRLARYEGGLWCAATAKLLAAILRLFGIEAGTYGYGYKGALSHLAHTTTVFLDGDRQYNVDAYLNYWWTDDDGGMMSFSRVLWYIAQGEHEAVKRIDRRVERVLVTPISDDPTAQRTWLFDGPIPASRTLSNGNMITPGATHNLDKLFLPRSPMWALAQKVIGQRDMPTFLLDMMLVNPRASTLSGGQNAQSRMALG